jgi:hypothetical protein
MSEFSSKGYGAEWNYIPGDFWRICDRCGFKYRASETKREWTGLIVCAEKCWEPRHPQDYVKGTRDRQVVRDPRPEADDSFLTANEVTADDL